jgi:cytochrome c oxidase assembly protein subunit 15
MIFIGGYTRLSGSGLSMTDWRIEGRRLPWSEEEWVREFEEYKLFPEYKCLHAGMMDLNDFKRIYFIEWFHRMWGRTVGVLFGAPLVYFSVRRVLKAQLALRLTGLFALGLSQALMGWWMVKSGLEDPEKHTPTLGANQRPRVSPYRLASHWTAALTLYLGCLWTSFTLLRPSPSVLHPSMEAISAAKRLRVWASPVAVIVGLTLISGPFVAGNDAGHAFNTWPKMNYDWVPVEWHEAMAKPLQSWRLFFEDTAVVQFDHRCLAYSAVGSSLALFAYSRCLPLSPAAFASARILPLTVGAQMFLGIATLLLYVPIELGVAHQAGGVAVLTSLAHLLHTLRTPMVV